MGALSQDSSLSLSQYFFPFSENDKQYKKTEIKKFNLDDDKKNITTVFEIDFNKKEDSKEDYFKYLFSNYNKLTASEIEKLIEKIPLNNTIFNMIISEIYNSPDSYKLDLLISFLSLFDKRKYEQVIDYIKNSTINKNIRSYLIDAISRWDKIKPKKRIFDLKNIYNNEDNEFIRKIILDASNDIG